MSQQLQKKQAYILANIKQENQQDFGQYWINIGNNDFNQTSFQQVQRIVDSFNNLIHQKRKKQFQSNNKKYSYNQYQSNAHNEPSQVFIKNIQFYQQSQQQRSQVSQCHTVIIQKKSALDLLDSAMHQNKNYNNNYKSNQPKTEDLNSKKYDQFQFWTNTVNSKIQKPKQKVFTSPQIHKVNQYSINSPRNNEKFQNSNSSSSFEIFTSISGVNNSSPQLNQKSMIQQNTSPYLKKAKQNLYECQIKQQTRKRQDSNQNKISKMTSLSKDISKNIQFDQQIQCFKSKPINKISDSNIQISIQKHQIISKVLFSNYAMYSIKIQPLAIECKRNHQDFLRLRTLLKKGLPGICLPYLQQVSMFQNTGKQQYIQHQKKMLQFFCRDLIRNRQIVCSKTMEKFLTLKQHKSIKRIFQQYDKMQQSKCLEQLCTIQGKIYSTLDLKQSIYNQNIPNFINKMNNLFQKQQHLTNNLIDKNKQLMDIYTQLRKITQQMNRQVKLFNQKVSINQFNNLSPALQIIQKSYEQQWSNLKFQLQIQQKKILPFITYQRKNFMQLHQIINLQKKFKKSFDKRSLTQKIGVGQQYNRPQMKRFKKSVIQQSQNLLVLKYQTGYFGYMLRNQSQRIFNQLGQKIIQRWKELSKFYIKRSNISNSYWEKVNQIKSKKSANSNSTAYSEKVI